MTIPTPLRYPLAALIGALLAHYGLAPECEVCPVESATPAPEASPPVPPLSTPAPAE